MDCLKGKTAVVTGASSGIGRQTAIKLAEEGCRVVIAARRSDKLDETAAKMPQNAECLAVQADITNQSDVRALFDAAVQRFGSLDILVNNAGRGLKADIADIQLEDWQKTLDVNLTGVFLCSREALRIMKKRGINGKIITVSSMIGLLPAPGFAAYGASKHGVTGFMWSLYWEAKSSGIKTASIYPARVDTEFFDSHGYDERPSKGQMLSARDIAEHVAAAASGSFLRTAGVVLRNCIKRIKGYFSLLLS
ncbi:putative oxidoreductase [Sedimentisphaera cyanobacteriorum]|uniref:Putative oxidoreductase n=1 Tax=Sedimentisphaera cyanobacteriorum TaxID=1940790 RepID=A0A1Q2HR31_9BACT|nr:SDR family oxidoreductase [Sedimentisphaera cyanobacteriorum]AQQ09791.1 putative oxidoreductase [Sedimentisphaera cyanobacteriorum]